MTNTAVDHPITLEVVFFTKSVVIAIQEHNPANASPVAPANSLDVAEIPGSPGRYQAMMRTTFNTDMSPDAPYMVEMECVGLFSANDTLTKEEANRGVTITAHSVLYGAIREAVSWLTARQPFGPLALGLSVLQPTKTEKAE